MSDTAYMIIVAMMGLGLGIMLGLALGEPKPNQTQEAPPPPLQTPPSILLRQRPIQAVRLPEFLSRN